MLGRYRLFAAAALLASAFACAQKIADTASAEGNLLPNTAVADPVREGLTYRKIAQTFKDLGAPDVAAPLDLAVTDESLKAFNPAWPIAEQSGKTSVLNRDGTPVLFANFGYYHTGMDILRTDDSSGTEVLAPHDGIALTFDWTGNRVSAADNPSAYTTIVAIYDPASHVITQMMHVAPVAELLNGGVVTVQKGKVLGKLTPAPLTVAADANRLSNVKITFIDGKGERILNAAKLFKVYQDTTKPLARNIYIAGDDAAPRSQFKANSKFDVVLEALDRDDNSGRNLEIASIAYTIKDQDGTVLLAQDACNFGQLYESISASATDQTARARELIDFGSAIAQQISGAWPTSDVDNSARTFRYSLTNFAVNADGVCSVVNDSAGNLTVGNNVKRLDVTVTVTDPSGNSTTTTFPPILRAVDADAGDASP